MVLHKFPKTQIQTKNSKNHRLEKFFSCKTSEKCLQAMLVGKLWESRKVMDACKARGKNVGFI
jgi:hypothetical protein